jgi:hypothetical protein
MGEESQKQREQRQIKGGRMGGSTHSLNARSLFMLTQAQGKFIE